MLKSIYVLMTIFRFWKFMNSEQIYYSREKCIHLNSMQFSYLFRQNYLRCFPFGDAALEVVPYYHFFSLYTTCTGWGWNHFIYQGVSLVLLMDAVSPRLIVDLRCSPCLQITSSSYIKIILIDQYFIWI